MKGWICAKCDSSFSPKIEECKYCNGSKVTIEDPKFTFEDTTTHSLLCCKCNSVLIDYNYCPKCKVFTVPKTSSTVTLNVSKDDK